MGEPSDCIVWMGERRFPSVLLVGRSLQILLRVMKQSELRVLRGPRIIERIAKDQLFQCDSERKAGLCAD